MAEKNISGPHRQSGQFEGRAQRTPSGRATVRFRRRDGRGEIAMTLAPEDARALALVLHQAIDDLAAVGGDRG